MSTIGIKSEVTLATTKTRASIQEFYKGIECDKVTQQLPLVINATETETISVSNSNFVMIIPDEAGVASGDLEVTLTTALGSMLLTGVGFLMMNYNNITSIAIKNTRTVDPINVFLMY